MRFVVVVNTRKESGPFRSNYAIAEEIIDWLGQANQEDLDIDGSVYVIERWDVTRES